MTDSVIKPVAIPASSRLHDGGSGESAAGTSLARRVLPLPTVPTLRTGRTVYGLAAVDCRGRIADHAVVTALGWRPGIRLDIRECQGLLVIRSDPHGVFSVTKQGHLRLPAAVRRCCGLVPGDRVLLAAVPKRGVLVVHPPAALDCLLAPSHGEVLDGDLA